MRLGGGLHLEQRKLLANFFIGCKGLNMKYYNMTLGILKNENEQFFSEGIEYIMRDEDKALIPCIESNPDYVLFLNDTEKIVEDFDYEEEELRQQEEQLKITNKLLEEELIQEKIRELAISELIKEGKLSE
jgi:hypothetical protein